jgi:hypothetical protein
MRLLCGRVKLAERLAARTLELVDIASESRDELGLPHGRYERMRVCDALLFRRGLPLYPVPGAGESPQGWQHWIGVGFEMYAALAELGVNSPEGWNGRIEPATTAKTIGEGMNGAIFALRPETPRAIRTIPVTIIAPTMSE